MNLQQHPHPERAPIATNEAHVWTVRLNATDSRIDGCFAVLSMGERERAAEFALDAPRRRFVAARAALRSVLGRYLATSPADVRLTVDGNGKPRLDEQMRQGRELDLRFNVAHSGNLIVIGVTRSCEIGVDVEQLRVVEHSQQIARRYFHPAEGEAIRTAAPADREAAFMRCWTAKEAVLKAVGAGIIGSLSDIRVPIDVDAGGWIEMPTRAHNRPQARCWLERIDIGSEYLAAVAFVDERRIVRILEFDWQSQSQ